MPRYTLIQRLLHWALALMILGALGVGMIFGILEYKGTVETFGNDMTNTLYKYHKTFGVLILAFMVVRIVVKIRLGKPEYATPLTRFENAASNALHGLFYLLVPLMAVLGWLATGASGFPVEFFNWTLPAILGKDKELGALLFQLHGIVGWILLILVIVHIAAAVKHWLVKRDGVMARMSLF
ncbi:MAG: cytochrome b [Pseudomonadota bacterium]